MQNDEQRAKNKEQRMENKEHRAENKEQGSKGTLTAEDSEKAPGALE